MRQYYIETTEEFGRGLYATYDLKPGTVLFIAEVLVLNENDTIKVNETDLKYYTFKYDTDRDCLVLGDGEIFNHSDTPNVDYKLIQYETRKCMMFVATKEVLAGEQLFIDYSADIGVNTSEYKDKNLL